VRYRVFEPVEVSAIRPDVMRGQTVEVIDPETGDALLYLVKSVNRNLGVGEYSISGVLVNYL